MISVFFVWLIISSVFITFGHILIQLVGGFFHKEDRYNYSDLFFLGLCFVGTILGITSIWIPTNITLLYVFSSIAIIYIFYKRKEFQKKIRESISLLNSQPFIIKLLLVIVVALILVLSVYPPIFLDAGLYHLQAILWNESYAVVPGLGNIHGRFGFNSNLHLLSPVFSLNHILEEPIYAINSVSILFFMLWVIFQLAKEIDWQNKVILAVYSFLFISYYYNFISYTSTDILPNVLISYLLLRVMIDQSTVTINSLLYVIIPVFSLTLKLSVFPLCLFVLLILFNLFKSKSYHSIIVLVALTFVIISPWLVRNVYLSGYLIYPFPALDLFSVDWKVPLDVVQEEKINVYSWALLPEISYSEITKASFLLCQKIWLLRMYRFSTIPLLILMLAVISPIIMLQKRRNEKIKNIFFIWLIAFAGSVFWWLLAPDFRFGYAFILGAALIPFRLYTFQLNSKYIQNLVYALLISGFVFLIYKGGAFINACYSGTDKSIASFILKPGSLTFLKERNGVEYTKTTLSNFDLYTPGSSKLCYDCDLPCSPALPSYMIEMRGDDLKYGFRIKK